MCSYLRVSSPWGPCMFGGHWQGPGCTLTSGLSPPPCAPSPSFVHSLDLSELAKAARRSCRAVSLLRQGPPSLTLCSCYCPPSSLLPPTSYC